MRPPGPPPLVLLMRLAGAAEPIVLSFDREAEPAVVGRIEELVDLGAYDGARLRVKPATAAVELAADPAPRRVEPRRIRHSQHKVGAIGWSWSKTPGDGNGEFYIVRRDEPGYDAAYQTIGAVVGGLQVLLGLPVEPTALRPGQKPPAPTVIESVRRMDLDVAAL